MKSLVRPLFFLSLGLFATFSLDLLEGEVAEGQVESFLPTWKLMSDEEKQQFIAGYLQGWRDAAKVTDIAISFVKSNPQRAIASLEGIKELYNIREIRPSEVTQEIDLFYADPSNSNAPLSKAITAARARIH
jgi:hypothetical protein